MESSTATLNMFDFKLLKEESKVPNQFVWPSKDLVETTKEELDVPVIDLVAIKNDEAAMAAAAETVRETCIKHGFFQVTNHGVDPNLIASAYQEFDSIFGLPLSEKLRHSAKRNAWGYSVAHGDRFASSLPWKECFTFPYKYVNESESQVVDFFNSVLGEDHQRTGVVYQKYCEAMKEISGVILELLAISLGVDRLRYRRFYEDAQAMMRCNFYPACNGNLTLGTGPHCDPTSVTILNQDQVGGLEIFVDDKWFAVRPRPNTFVINIGDTFKAFTNGIYKSCLHRVLANRIDRKSLAFFLCPKGDKTVRAPETLFGKQEERNYPDFTWSQFFEFTQKHHRADPATLQDFVSWLRSSNP